MRDAGPAPGWSNKFKRQIVLIAMIGISPMMGFLSHASDVPRALVSSLCAAGFVALGIGAWYLFGPRARLSEEPMTARERWISIVALTALMTLIAFDYYKFY